MNEKSEVSGQASQSNTGLAPISGLPSNRIGPIPWAECTDEQKIERLRQELDGWRRVCGELRDRMDLMEAHGHAADGKVTVQLDMADRIHRNSRAQGSFNTLR